MTHLAGETVWRPTDFEQWLSGMASLLPEVHSISSLPNSALQSFEPYFPENSAPDDSRRPSLWPKALEVAADYRQLGSDHLIHRDFHPGNLLWSSDSLPGLVDWMSACWGPSSMDVSHCRMNLIESHDLVTADRFKTVYETVSGKSFDPTADVITAVDWLADLQQRKAGDLMSVEENLAKALAQIR
jgi:aminoglycoside phosphotransferase (APT) family kinase protein